MIMQQHFIRIVEANLPPQETTTVVTEARELPQLARDVGQ